MDIKFFSTMHSCFANDGTYLPLHVTDRAHIFRDAILYMRASICEWKFFVIKHKVSLITQGEGTSTTGTCSKRCASHSLVFTHGYLRCPWMNLHKNWFAQRYVIIHWRVQRRIKLAYRRRRYGLRKLDHRPPGYQQYDGTFFCCTEFAVLLVC